MKEEYQHFMELFAWDESGGWDELEDHVAALKIENFESFANRLVSEVSLAEIKELFLGLAQDKKDKGVDFVYQETWGGPEHNEKENYQGDPCWGMGFFHVLYDDVLEEHIDKIRGKIHGFPGNAIWELA